MVASSKYSNHENAPFDVAFSRRFSEEEFHTQTRGIGLIMATKENEDEIVPPCAKALTATPWCPAFTALYGGGPKDKLTFEFNKSTACVHAKGARNVVTTQITCLLAYLGRVSLINAPKKVAGKGPDQSNERPPSNSSEVAKAIFQHLDRL